MNDNAREDIEKVTDYVKPAFYVPAVDYHVQIVSKNDLMLEQILKNQLIIMQKLQMDLDIITRRPAIYEKDFFEDAINETQELLNGEMK